MKLIVTIDVEEISGPGWICPPVPEFRGVTQGLKNVLQPMFDELGVKPTLLISPIVLHSDESAETLAKLKNVELGAHLHWEQIDPGAVRTLKGGPQKNWAMQWDYPPEKEMEKLTALTELFRKRFGYGPTSFRAGRYGASKSTGALLKQLGYEVDSSASPHVKWPTSHNDWIDFTQAPEQPYTIAAPGNVYEKGDFDFLEVPITIVAKEQIPSAKQQPWLRPAYSTRETLLEIVRIVRERNATGIEQPLVMMFHNVEVIPNASPYTKTDEDVRAYLDDIRTALKYAIDLGFKPVTLTEYARGYKNSLAQAQNVRQEYEKSLRDTANLDNGISIPFADVRRVVDRHGVDRWHHNIYRTRNERLDVMTISQWVRTNLPKDTPILSAGCGLGFNLYWHARNGFTDLSGFDVYDTIIAASKELAGQHGVKIDLWAADMQNPEHGFKEKFGYIEAMNCTMYNHGALERFMASYVKALKPQGYMAFDAIDSSFNTMANNQWETNDWKKPVHERRPSEYVDRYSQEETVSMAARHGLKIVAVHFLPAIIPLRKIYIFQKTDG